MGCDTKSQTSLIPASKLVIGTTLSSSILGFIVMTLPINQPAKAWPNISAPSINTPNPIRTPTIPTPVIPKPRIPTTNFPKPRPPRVNKSLRRLPEAFDRSVSQPVGREVERGVNSALSICSGLGPYQCSQQGTWQMYQAIRLAKSNGYIRSHQQCRNIATESRQVPGLGGVYEAMANASRESFERACDVAFQDSIANSSEYIPDPVIDEFRNHYYPQYPGEDNYPPRIDEYTGIVDQLSREELDEERRMQEQARKDQHAADAWNQTQRLRHERDMERASSRRDREAQLISAGADVAKSLFSSIFQRNRRSTDSERPYRESSLEVQRRIQDQDREIERLRAIVEGTSPSESSKTLTAQSNQGRAYMDSPTAALMTENQAQSPFPNYEPRSTSKVGLARLSTREEIQYDRLSLRRAANTARMAAEKQNGGLSIYHAESCMHQSGGGRCFIRGTSDGFLFRFLGGSPGWERLNISPTVETIVEVSRDGATVIKIANQNAASQSFAR